jgi:hypothetical protein
MPIIGSMGRDLQELGAGGKLEWERRVQARERDAGQ